MCSTTLVRQQIETCRAWHERNPQFLRKAIINNVFTASSKMYTKEKDKYINNTEIVRLEERIRATEIRITLI